MSKVVPIVLHPHQALRQQAVVLENVTDDVRGTLSDMLVTVRCASGVGLAAPQINLNQRLVVIDPAVDPEPGQARAMSIDKPLLMVNPTILAASGDMIDSEEGCLSIPWLYDIIQRHAWVKVGYIDEQGNPREVEGEGLLSRCLQHEIDHLNGVLFIDHLSRLKRGLADKKYAKILPGFVAEKPYPFSQE